MIKHWLAKSPLLAIVLLAFLAACHRDQEHSAELYVFGTIVEVKLWGASEQQADQAIADLQQMFQGMHRDWHAWEPGRLTDINRAFAAGRPAEADAGIVEMIRSSQSIEQLTEGRFNPAIGGLIRLWGFHTSDFPVIGPAPSQAEIDQFLIHKPSTRDIHIEGLQVSSENPYVQLDFGGIAKGYAVDLAIEHLRQLGIASAVVNAGGDLRAMGRHGDRPWRVAVRKPGGGIIGAVEVRGDESLFTSGTYERFHQDEQKRYPHILDPHSGWPVQGVASATVITDLGILADGAATALVVAGVNGWPDVARALDLDQVMIVDQSGMVYLTPEMEQRMRFSGDVKREIVTLSNTGPAMTAELELPPGIQTYPDGRLPIEALYRAYTSLLEKGWQLDVITQSQPPGREYALPVIALRTPRSGQALWIVAGIHGEEPAGPNAIAAAIEDIAALGEQRAVVLMPLNNPQGYTHNWRYLNVPVYSASVEGQSVGDSSHLLFDPENPGHARAAAASSPEAAAITRYLVALSATYPPVYSIDLHEDNLIGEGYVYSQGRLGAGDPLALAAVRVLEQNGIPLKISGQTRFGETIDRGIIGPVIDGSIDELMSAASIMVDGQPQAGPGARTVLVFETPADRVNLPTRIAAHLALLQNLAREIGQQAPD